MSADDIKTRVEDHILEVIIDRPKANAIDRATSIRMGEIFSNYRDNPELRVAILTGGGKKFFSAGWDLKAAAAGEEETPAAGGGLGGIGGPTGGVERRSSALSVEISNRHHMHTRRMPCLRKKHGGKFSSTNNADTDRPSLFAALGKQVMEIHDWAALLFR